jgi:WD repeat-containing protein 45
VSIHYFPVRSVTCNLYLHSNRQSTFSPLTPFLPLPKYFDSEWSYAQYRIPAQSSHISISTPSPRPPTADVADEERCMVGWIETPVPDSAEGQRSVTEYQLIALTYTGGWYRLGLPNSGTSNTPPTSPSRSVPISGSPPKSTSAPRHRTSSNSSMIHRLDKGKDRERDKEGKESRECTLQEYRRFGRWDGWG